MSSYLIETLAAAPNVDVRTRTEVVGGCGEGRLEQLTLRDSRSAEESTVEAAALFVLIGVRPHTDWLPSEVERDERGFVPTALTSGRRHRCCRSRRACRACSPSATCGTSR